MENIETTEKTVYISSDQLLENAQILYEFTDLFTTYENTVRDYTHSGDLFSMIEIHTLVAIEANPGCLLTELAVLMRRSKSFVSQVANKLEKNGLIVRLPDEKDAKKKHLYVSKEGKIVSDEHNSFDQKQLIKTYNYLLRDCTEEDIEKFYKVMKVYNNIMSAAARKRARLQAENNIQVERK